jgi:hypothetical protein
MGGSKKRRAKQAAAVDPDAMAVDEDVDMDGAPEPEEDESDDEQVSYTDFRVTATLKIHFSRTRRWRWIPSLKAETPVMLLSCP